MLNEWEWKDPSAIFNFNNDDILIDKIMQNWTLDIWGHIKLSSFYLASAFKQK